MSKQDVKIFLLKAIMIRGSRRILSKELGVSPQVINSWLNRRVNIPLQYALEIERLTEGEITWQSLTPYLKDTATLWKESKHPIANTFTIRRMHVPVSQIKHTCQLLAPTELLQDLCNDIDRNGLKNPICMMDDDLVFGEKRLHAFEILGKETIPVWRLFLPDLINGNYNKDELCRRFALSERVAISLSTKKLLKKYKEQPNDSSHQQNFIKITGGTDDFIANSLNFGNRETYNQAKKVFEFGSPELIDAVDQKRVAVSSATLLMKLPFSEQSQILADSNKAVKAAISLLRKHQSPFNKKTPTEK